MKLRTSGRLSFGRPLRPFTRPTPKRVGKVAKPATRRPVKPVATLESAESPSAPTVEATPEAAAPMVEATPAVPAPKVEKKAAQAAPSIDKLMLKKLDDGWGLMVDDVTEPAWVLSTKKKAVSAGKREAESLSAPLEIYTGAGKLQETYAP